MRPLHLSSPAKINLMLAVTGRRPDGFHDLLSVVAPLAWGDALTVEPEVTPEAANKEQGGFMLTCDDPAVPVDETNLVLKAANAFRAATGWTGGARFSLKKRIPMGAGLGGGSSNAAAALRALNELAGFPLTSERLADVASGVGSDCALFLRDGPVVMRGRGERVTDLPPAAAQSLRGREALVFKPAFGISTPWAYAQLAAEAPDSYLAAEAAEARLSRWSAAADPASENALSNLLYNNMERPAFRKFPALPALLDRLQARFGLSARMSGSGSACFALLPPRAPVGEIRDTVRESWGESVFVVHTHLA